MGVSLAVARLSAAEAGLKLFEYLGKLGGIKHPELLPTPMMNIINGGVHADSGLEFQEMMIVPKVSKSFRENLRAGVEIFHCLKKLLSEKGLTTTVGDEGGFAPRLKSHEEALDLILAAIKKAGYRAGQQIFIALDTASSEFFKNGKY